MKIIENSSIILVGNGIFAWLLFFLTTKVWISNAGYEKAKASIEESLKKLQTQYIDRLLIHQPFGDYYGIYLAMEEAYKEGKVRAIGVSNSTSFPAAKRCGCNSQIYT